MNYPEKARRVFDIEIGELQRLRDRLDGGFTDAIGVLLDTLKSRRKIVVCGVGKSGNIGRKLVATLNSTGATAVNLNVGDALHGDLGVIDDGDLAIVLSHSGETEEILNLLPHLRRLSMKIIAITGGAQSLLARHADVVLDVAVTQEACPLNLAPTSSTTNMLVLCDALAMVLLEARGFQQDDFARLHPGGSLGRALLTRVSDLMRSGEMVAFITPDTAVSEALKTMTRARSGAAIVRSADGGLAGVFTHGDFVRAFQKSQSIADKPVSEFMTPKPVSIHADKLAAEVLATLEQHRVDDIVVIDADGKPVGMVDTQDLTRLKIV
jgi:arabinose-5-phosphate isomerase